MLGVGGLWAARLLTTAAVFSMTFLASQASYAPSQVNINTKRRVATAKTEVPVSRLPVSLSLPESVPIGYRIEDTPRQTQDYETMLSAQLHRYSSKFFKNIGLKTIYVVGDIYDGNTKILGYTQPEQGVIVLSAEEDRVSDPLVISTIHHELAHLMIEAHEDRGRDIQSSWPFARVDKTSNRPLFPAEGFVSRYAMTSWFEDLADTFGFYQTPYYKDKIDKQVETDPVLEEKLRLINQLQIELS